MNPVSRKNGVMPECNRSGKTLDAVAHIQGRMASEHFDGFSDMTGTDFGIHTPKFNRISIGPMNFKQAG